MRTWTKAPTCATSWVWKGSRDNVKSTGIKPESWVKSIHSPALMNWFHGQADWGRCPLLKSLPNILKVPRISSHKKGKCLIHYLLIVCLISYLRGWGRRFMQSLLAGRKLQISWLSDGVLCVSTNTQDKKWWNMCGSMSALCITRQIVHPDRLHAF